MATTETVTISELEVGDVVLTHGMRVLLDVTPMEYPTRYGLCRSFCGLVLNIDEIVDPFLLAHTRVDGLDERRWTIQSNDLMRWTREVAR